MSKTGKYYLLTDFKNGHPNDHIVAKEDYANLPSSDRWPIFDMGTKVEMNKALNKLQTHKTEIETNET